MVRFKNPELKFKRQFFRKIYRIFRKMLLLKKKISPWLFLNLWQWCYMYKRLCKASLSLSSFTVLQYHFSNLDREQALIRSKHITCKVTHPSLQISVAVGKSLPHCNTAHATLLRTSSLPERSNSTNRGRPPSARNCNKKTTFKFLLFLINLPEFKSLWNVATCSIYLGQPFLLELHIQRIK